MRRPGWLSRDDRGSMAVELVVAALGFALLLVLVSGGGQWLNLTGDVGSAARDAAREASIALSYQQAKDNALAAAQADLGRTCTTAPQVDVEMFLSGRRVLGDAAFATAQDLEVTVTCQASLSAFSDVGFKVSSTFSDTAAAPLDPFVDRG
jgi:Flp pilus assembly protein TadG